MLRRYADSPTKISLRLASKLETTNKQTKNQTKETKNRLSKDEDSPIQIGLRLASELNKKLDKKSHHFVINSIYIVSGSLFSSSVSNYIGILVFYYSCIQLFKKCVHWMGLYSFQYGRQ